MGGGGGKDQNLLVPMPMEGHANLCTSLDECCGLMVKADTQTYIFTVSLMK